MIYASLAQISCNDKISSRDFGESSQLTNCILDSGATCNVTLQVLDFIPCLLEDTEKYIEVADEHHFTAKQKVQFQIKICDNNRDPFIATLQSILLAPDLCDRLFYIIMLMNLGHTCLFYKGFCTVYFCNKEKNAVTLPHSEQWKHAFLGKIKQMSKSRK